MCYKVPCYLRPGYFLNSTLRTVFPSQQDDELMKILRRVGPDTLIPCFAVNIRGNKDVQIANEVNQAVFNDLSHISAEETSKRIPLIVTLSTMEAHKHPLKAFKKRLGVRMPNTALRF